MAKHREYYKGEGGGFPQVWVMVSLVNLCMHVAHPPLYLFQFCKGTNMHKE